MGDSITYTACAALLIGALLRLAKADRLPVDIPPRWRPTAALALGLAAAAGDALGLGAAWPAALMAGLSAAGLASLGHGVAIEGVRGGREIGRSRPGSEPSDPGRLSEGATDA